jgi:hypothetical protein
LTVNGNLTLSPGAVETLTEASETEENKIILRGDFNNYSTYPSWFNWSEGLIILDGAGLQVIEVAGLDLGETLEGFLTDEDTLFDTDQHTNFSMGTLRVGTDTEPATVRFVNNFASTVGSGPCEEALYVDTLVLEAGSTVIVSDGRVYYTQVQDFGGTIILEGCGDLVCLSASSTPVLETLDIEGDPLNRKNRFMSITGTDAGRQQAIRVVVGPEDLGRGAIPPPFDSWQFQEYYAGEPRPYCENSGQGSSVRPDVGGCGLAPGVYANDQVWFWAAPLFCDMDSAHFMDWTTLADYCNTPGIPAYDAHSCDEHCLPGGGTCNVDTSLCEGGDNAGQACCGTGTCGVSAVVHLYHEAIVPSHMAAGAGPINVEAVYEASLIDSACVIGLQSSYSDPAQDYQAGCGDVNTDVTQVPNGPPNESVGVVSDVV